MYFIEMNIKKQTIFGKLDKSLSVLFLVFFVQKWGEAIYQVGLLGGADRMDKRGQSQCVSYTCTSHGVGEVWGLGGSALGAL